MTTIKIPIDNNPTQDVKDNLDGFLKDLVDLCNKRRIWVVLQATGYLRDEIMNGKLLDVAGFYYDEKVKNVLPYYVDRMSGDKPKE
jgi:hypothetical protein